MPLLSLVPRLVAGVCLLSVVRTAGAQQSAGAPFSPTALRSGAHVRLLAAGERAEGTVASIAGEAVVLKGKNVLTAGYPFATIDSAWTGEPFTRSARREGLVLGLVLGGATSAAYIARWCSEAGCSGTGVSVSVAALVAIGGLGGALIGSGLRVQDTRWQLVHPLSR